MKTRTKINTKINNTNNDLVEVNDKIKIVEENIDKLKQTINQQ